MEHDAEALPIEFKTLADLAHKCHAHAKALHYKENVFSADPAGCVDDLISINKKLDQVMSTPPVPLSPFLPFLAS